MPSASGPHSSKNVKVADFPADLNKDMIIGYTGSKTVYPTVYFTSGHYTQKHPERWNLGWDSYEGWECKFFGNVPILKKPPPNYQAPDSSTDAQGQAIPIADYVRNLKSLGKNRFKGGNTRDQNNWILDKTLDTQPGPDKTLRLREFWIRNTGQHSRDRVAHPSRNPFIPFLFSDSQTRDDLWKQVLGPRARPRAARTGSPPR